MRTMLIFLIKTYQRVVSPLFPGEHCRFYPTCSTYAIQAIAQHGPLKGSILSVKRILRCHPLHSGGYDPIP